MNVLRFLKPACIQLPLLTQPIPPPADDTEEETAGQLAKRRHREKEAVMTELAGVLARAPEIVNPSKLLRDLQQRERNATTAIGGGVAIPHVRTLQARAFLMGFARAAGDGLHYEALDGEPVRLFFLMAAPPYDDRTYHHVHREVATILRDEDTVDALLAARDAQDVFNTLRRFFH